MQYGDTLCSLYCCYGNTVAMPGVANLKRVKGYADIKYLWGGKKTRVRIQF